MRLVFVKTKLDRFKQISHHFNIYLLLKRQIKEAGTQDRETCKLVLTVTLRTISGQNFIIVNEVDLNISALASE